MEDSLVHLCFPDSETVLLRCHQKKKKVKKKRVQSKDLKIQTAYRYLIIEVPSSC